VKGEIFSDSAMKSCNMVKGKEIKRQGIDCEYYGKHRVKGRRIDIQKANMIDEGDEETGPCANGSRARSNGYEYDEDTINGPYKQKKKKTKYMISDKTLS
jgi:hypothetical protein